MDIEYGPDKAETAYELAAFYRDQKIDVLFFLTAWCWEPYQIEEMGNKNPF